MELKAEPADSTSQSKSQFTGSSSQQQYSTYTSLQFYVSLLKYYNLVMEFQLAHTGSTVASYKLMSLRVLTDGNEANDGVGDQLENHAEVVEGIWLPQMYTQWAQINIFTFIMDAYLMWVEMTISTQNVQLANFMATGGDLQGQMQSVRAANAMESMNF